MAGTVRIERDGVVARLVFDHAERRNAITVSMWERIPLLVAELEADDSVRVVIMTGAGHEAFVSGADISEFETTRVGNNAPGYDALTARAFGALEAFSKPLIACIHGFCIGGGAAIALCADFRYCADDATFAVPPAKLGLGYHLAGVQSIVRAVGFPTAAEILFTAAHIDAKRAEHIRLVSRVFPKADLDAQVTKIARLIAENAPLTVRTAKLTLRELTLSSDERNPELVQSRIQQCYDSDDFKEGVRAFLEKRAPRFQGR